ncbi:MULTISPECIES: hypothetical protein [Haloferax]|uniref:CARDB domain-containing protein n=1 Tax=Haloferax marinum TaxID=2666143 RepID=A0A6A8G637_9EURY|nr:MULTISPECIES: hypothetical protein [Haloferax]KAB1196725.1 hypothetical protein Hfx1150_03990 [Haloferax sp. CBA1150]MRW95733.1 hypothetical protein [Haloferax marinum]
MSPSTRSRREILGLGGTALALLTGCLSEPPSTSGGSALAGVTVSNVQIVPEVVALAIDSIGTHGDRDEQFALVTILVDGERGPAVDEFSLSTDEETFSPTPPDDLPRGGRLWNRGYAYGGRRSEEDRSESGYLVFQVPNPLGSAEVVFHGPGGQFQLGASARETLARPPTEFAVSDVTASETVESREEMTVTATIENVGSHDGTFVGALNRVGPLIAYVPVERVEIDLSAGESTTWEHSYNPSLDGGTESRKMQFKLNWRDGRISTETTVEPSS